MTADGMYGVSRIFGISIKSLIQKAYESKWKKEKLLVYAKNEKEHRQQKIEEEPYQQMDLSSFIDTGKNHVPDFGTNKG